MKKIITILAVSAVAFAGFALASFNSQTCSLEDSVINECGFRCSHCKGTGFTPGLNTNCFFCKGTGRDSSY